MILLNESLNESTEFTYNNEKQVPPSIVIEEEEEEEDDNTAVTTTTTTSKKPTVTFNETLDYQDVPAKDKYYLVSEEMRERLWYTESEERRSRDRYYGEFDRLEDKIENGEQVPLEAFRGFESLIVDRETIVRAQRKLLQSINVSDIAIQVYKNFQAEHNYDKFAIQRAKMDEYAILEYMKQDMLLLEHEEVVAPSSSTTTRERRRERQSRSSHHQHSKREEQKRRNSSHSSSSLSPRDRRLLKRRQFLSPRGSHSASPTDRRSRDSNNKRSSSSSSSSHIPKDVPF